MKSLSEAIERANSLLKTVQNGVMATVNVDNSPHNTPYFFLINKERSELYWVSHPNSTHSKNILRTGQLYVVLFEAQQGGGLYIKAHNGRITHDNELTRALAQHNKRRIELGRSMIPADYYSKESSQRMWIADIEQFWVNRSVRDDNGRITEDVRTPIDASDLKF